jgi:ubiquinone/menaquinone biosynthesis C-methylase UbiE
MKRLKEIIEFIEFDRGNGYYLEPESRYSVVQERLFDVIKTYNPKVIVKAGLGNEKLLFDIVRNYDIYLVVVEPSLKALMDFLKHPPEEGVQERIRLINGNFHEFPVDYYAADLLICIDYLSFFDSSKSLDEFKRALQFEGILFFSDVVLVNDDLEGIYDDFKRIIFPLHNDHYLEADLRTFIELKDFTFLKGMMTHFKKNLKSEIEYFHDIFDTLSIEEALGFIEKNRDDFIRFYSLDEDLNIKEPYFVGYFSRNRIK